MSHASLVEARVVSKEIVVSEVRWDRSEVVDPVHLSLGCQVLEGVDKIAIGEFSVSHIRTHIHESILGLKVRVNNWKQSSLQASKRARSCTHARTHT